MRRCLVADVVHLLFSPNERLSAAWDCAPEGKGKAIDQWNIQGEMVVRRIRLCVIPRYEAHAVWSAPVRSPFGSASQERRQPSGARLPSLGSLTAAMATAILPSERLSSNRKDHCLGPHRPAAAC